MCGIVGFMGGIKGLNVGDGSGIVSDMLDSIKSRGPDSYGVWQNLVDQIWLGHRRLSIMDLSAAGSQPMHSMSNRYVIVFNGEIYNHVELRHLLANTQDGLRKWRGHSDTETVLAAFDVWGIEATIERLVGMFAMAIWDCELRILTLVRDRMGEKPLYYGWQNINSSPLFIFASELKAVRVHPQFTGLIDRNSLASFMRHGYVPTPSSIYEGIKKLEPGCLIRVKVTRDGDCNIHRYWDPLKLAVTGFDHGSSKDISASTNELHGLLKNTISQQMVADVPIGAFLSGGIDSSTIAALMQEQSNKPIKTFTIGFNEGGYDEAIYAKAIASYIGSDHHELYVTPQQALDVIPKLSSIYCEPFGDSSQIPTFLLSKLAREHVAVSLSGDGADELFCGYNRYLFADKAWNTLEKIPLGLRDSLSHKIECVNPITWDSIFEAFHFLTPKKYRQLNWGDKIYKVANILASKKFEDLYRGVVSQWKDTAGLVIGGSEYQTILTNYPSELMKLNNINKMMFLDMVTYLPDDILVKVDRAGMANSLETRMPFLNHQIVEFSLQLPNSFKMSNGQTKYILRKVLERYLPNSLVNRPKMGFGVPLDSWLRGPLREWAEELLDEKRLISEGYFNSRLIRQKWDEHISGSRNWHHQIWNVLMFQSWLETQGDD